MSDEGQIGNVLEGIAFGELAKVATVEKPETNEADERGRHVRDLLIGSGLGLLREDVHRVIRNELTDSKALVTVREWHRDRKRPWLLLCGGTGTGKTLAAAWYLRQLYREALEHRWPRRGQHYDYDVGRLLRSQPRAVRGSTLATRLRPWSHERTPHDDPHPHRYVVLDDLGTERLDDPRFAEALADFVEARLDLPTLVTTNLPRKDIRKRYGDRIADRWNHVAHAIEINDRSMRRTGAGL